MVCSEGRPCLRMPVRHLLHHLGLPKPQINRNNISSSNKERETVMAEAQTEPTEVVRRQLDAYNAKDIEAFMSCWAEDAQFFAFPSDLLAEGAQQIRDRHVVRFREPDLFGKLIHRMNVGNLVVDREVVTRNFPEGLGRVDVMAIYEVADDKIAKAWFKTGMPVLDKAS